jgi:hypothetical protein
MQFLNLLPGDLSPLPNKGGINHAILESFTRGLKSVAKQRRYEMRNSIEQTTSVVCQKSCILKYAVQIIVVTLLFAGLCSAQIQFALAVGGSALDYGYSVVQTTDDGYVVVGHTTSFGAGSHDLFIVKFSSSGSVQWSRAVGGSDGDFGYSVVQTTDDGYVVVGHTTSFGAGLRALFIVKFSTTGSMEWTRAVGGTSSDYGESVVQTSDGGCAVVGNTTSFGAGSCDLFIVKFSTSGSVQWSRAVGGGNSDYGKSVVQTSDGGYVVTGNTKSLGAGYPDLFLVKLSSSGSLEWAKAVGGTEADYGNSIVQTTDGGYVVVGYTTSFGAGYHDLFLVKLSSTGSLEWAKAVGGGSNDYGYSVIRTTDGGCAVAGNTKSFGAGSCDLFIVKFSSSGSVEWAKSAGGGNADYGYSIVRTTDAGYAVAGYTMSFGAGSYNLLLVKFDSDGNTCIGSAAFPTVTDVSPSVDSVSPTVTVPPLSISEVTPTITDVTPTVTVICTDISEVLSKPISFELTVSPNPFNSSCAIITHTSATVEIFDLQGRLVWNKPSDSDYIGATSLIKGGKPEEVPLNKGDVAKRQGVSASAQGVIIWQPEESISSGVYLVRATTDEGQQITKRIVYLK